VHQIAMEGKKTKEGGKKTNQVHQFAKTGDSMSECATTSPSRTKGERITIDASFSFGSKNPGDLGLACICDKPSTVLILLNFVFRLRTTSFKTNSKTFSLLPICSRVR
jgi:hypothetical protein